MLWVTLYYYIRVVYYFASLLLTGWAIMYVSVGDGEKGKKVAILQTIFMAISHKL